MGARTTTVKSKHNNGAAGKKGLRAQAARDDANRVTKSAKSKRTQSKGASLKQLTSTQTSKQRNKRRVYSEAELNIPKLNMVTPVGVQKPPGKKKGKVFVDDKESMLTILSLVHADKEGQIESKMQRARQLEEIREARKAEADKRAEMKRDKLEETKDSLRRKRRKRDSGGADADADVPAVEEKQKKGKRKSVSFA